jgi:two-component system cell cycle response regulator
VQADVPVETGVRGAMSRVTDAGETLDSILRQAAARMTRIEAAANSDGLTGLYNHRYFQERLEQELARARNHDESLALLFCDLDHFKLYNDTVGHQAGDEALRSMAKVLHQELRRVDIAARYGGEEFAVILPDTGREGALEVAERIRRAVESGRETAPRGLPLTVSIGVAVCPADAADAAEIVDRADWAMYRAKRKGRNRVEGFAAGDDDS